MERLARRGIWLEDASPLALYSPGGTRRTSGRTQRQLIRKGYTRFVWPEVANDAPEQVWVIGRGVAAALHGLPGIHPDRAITQPQGARDQSARDQFAADMKLLCTELQRVATG